MNVSLHATQDEGELLELHRVGEATYHFLDGKPVSHGDRLELRLSHDRWLSGTYEWSGHPARWPALRVALGGPWEGGDEEHPPAAVVALPPDARLRWLR